MSSLENALAILGLLSRDRPVLRVGEVCRELGIPKSTASRLLRAMSDHGMLEREQREPGYGVGSRALLLANLYLGRHSLLQLMDGALEALVAEFGFTGYVSTLSQADIVLLRLKQGSYPLRHVREIGAHLPAWRTAMGQSLLARLSDQAALACVAEGVGKDAEPAKETELLQALAATRRRGFAQAPSVFTPGVTTISTALLDARGGDLMALALAYPDNAANRSVQKRMTNRILERAKALGMQIDDPLWCGAVKG